MIAEACVDKPVRIATRLGIIGEVLHALVPRVAQIVMNSTFRMFPDSAAAKGDKEQEIPALAGGDRDGADDARHPFLTRLGRAWARRPGWAVGPVTAPGRGAGQLARGRHTATASRPLARSSGIATWSRAP